MAIEITELNGVPALVISAKSKFAPQVLRLLADLNMVHTEADPVEFLELAELAQKMEEWRAENPSECTP